MQSGVNARTETVQIPRHGTLAQVYIYLVRTESTMLVYDKDTLLLKAHKSCKSKEH